MPDGSTIECGVAGRPLTGEVESGDLHLVKALPDGLLLAVVDGLGHGAKAARAARLAVSALEAHAGEGLEMLVKSCHEQLRRTRGVVMTLASINPWDSRMAWIAVGNVEGLLVRARPAAGHAREYVVQRGGVVGDQLPSLRATTISLARGDLLILATDGINHTFTDSVDPGASVQDLADRILDVHGKSSDDALVLVARYLGVVP